MSEGSCQVLVETPYGSILGKPNAFWGTLYYPFLILVIAFTGLGIVDIELFIGLTFIAMIISLYLLWGLYILRTACPVCFVTHCVNLLILVTAISWRSA